MSLFEIQAREYAHFTFDAGARTLLRNVILGIAIGIILASLYAFYQKNVPGAVVRALLRAEAFSPDCAKTLTELGLEKNILIPFELAHNGMLKKLVRAATAEGEKESGETQEGEERYYIAEEDKYRAELRFDKAGNGPVSLIITAVLILAFAVLLIKLLPALLGIADRLMG